MLKLFFWLLLIANGAFLAFRMGYLDTLVASKSESERITKQLNVDKIKIVSGKKAPVSAPPATPPSSPTLPVASMSAASAPQAPSSASKKIVPCTEVGDFAPNYTKKIEARLETLAQGDRLAKRTIQEVATYIVYIPPQGEKAGADKKTKELKEMGVKNYFIIQDNTNMRWGISLGVFKSEAAAKNHLANLKKQGVRSAKVGARSVTGSRVAFVLRDLDESSLKALDKIMIDFPEQKARECGKE